MENEQKTGAAAQSKNQERPQDNKENKQKNTDGKTDAQDAKQVVKDTANKAVGQAKDKAVGIIDQKKQNLASGLNDVAESIRKVGENLNEADDQTSIGKAASNYGGSLADQVQNFSAYLEDANLKDFQRDIENFAHRQPLLFVGGAFALGLLAARFLKSSSPRGISSKYLREKNNPRGNTNRSSAN